MSFPIASWIHIVQWHPEGKTLAVGTLEKYVLLIDIDRGDIKALNASGGSRALDWNHTGQLLAVADLEGVIQIWHKDGSLYNTIDMQYGPDVVGESYLGIDWHPTKDILVAANFQINLLDASGTLLNVMEHTNPAAIILCAKWHPSGEFFVIGDYGHSWEGENVPSLLHFWSEDGALLKSVPGSKAEYRNISWNHDGSKLATASDVLRIWSENGDLLHVGPADGTNKLWGIDWADDGNRIVTSSRYKTIALWDPTARLIQRIDVGGR
jgi:WD40 repeat protein